MVLGSNCVSGSTASCTSPNEYCDINRICLSCSNLCSPLRFGGKENVKYSCIKYCKDYYTLHYVTTPSTTQAATSAVTIVPTMRPSTKLEFTISTIQIIAITAGVVLPLLIVAAIVYGCRRHRKSVKKDVKHTDGIELKEITNGNIVVTNGTCPIEEDPEETCLMKTYDMQRNDGQIDDTHRSLDETSQSGHGQREPNTARVLVQSDLSGTPHQSQQTAIVQMEVPRDGSLHQPHSAQDFESLHNTVNLQHSAPPQDANQVNHTQTDQLNGHVQQGYGREEVSYARTGNTTAYMSCNSRGTSGYNSKRTEGGREINHPSQT